MQKRCKHLNIAAKSIILLAAVLGQSVFSAAGAQIYSDADTLDVISRLAVPGDTVSIPINLVNSYYLGGFMFRLAYDSAAFEACSVDTASRSSLFDYRMTNLDEPGVIRYLATSFNPDRILEPGAGIIAYVNLYLRENPPGTVFTIALEDEDSTSHDNQLSSSLGDTLIIPVLLNGLVYVVQTGIDPVPALPNKTELYQNYPNPFNNSTTIAFSMGAAGNAAISVYDLIGRKVAVVADREFEAGRHTVKFDADGLKSGIYFYKIKTDHITDTKSMMLLK